MIDSIYIGITGIQSHQQRLTVIGNNVANINTTAFKGSRVAFSEVMSQTISEGTAPQGQIAATNPKQTGLGVGVASIDRTQGQGSLQLTGIDTDLAIEGDGLFVVSDGQRDFYTRDGTFSFDTQGRLVDPSTGLVVKGNIGNDDGSGLTEISFEAELKELIVPLNRESEARATTQVQLAGNLDAAGGAAPVWSEDTIFGQPARHPGVGTAGLTALNAQLDTATGAATLTLSVTEGGETAGGTITVPTKNYATLVELRDELNAQVFADDTLRGRVLFAQELVNGAAGLVVRTIAGGPDVSLEVADGATSAIPISSLLGFPTASPASSGEVVVGTTPTKLNSLANVGRALTDDDVIHFTGVKADGQRFNGQLVFTTNTTDDVQDLLTAVEQAYGDVTAAFEDGRLILTTKAPPGQQGTRVPGFDITFSLEDAPTIVTNVVDERSGLVGSEPPFTFSTNTQVFDELGESHSLTFTFVKGLVNNEWHWSAIGDGLTPDEGNVGTVEFLPDGTIDAFQATDGKNLTITPTNGAGVINIDIQATDPTGRLGGLTQFVASSSVAVRDQDGRASGNLVNVSIEQNGHIRGLFDNGDSQVFARVALATFGNAGGLRQEGSNLFAETIASGSVRTGEATTEIQGAIRAGHIELSNVDLAEEFTSMIVTQRGFQASARTITTSDEMLSELVNLKR